MFGMQAVGIIGRPWGLATPDKALSHGCSPFGSHVAEHLLDSLGKIAVEADDELLARVTKVRRSCSRVKIGNVCSITMRVMWV